MNRGDHTESETTTRAGERVGSEPARRSAFLDVWKRFRRNRSGVAGLIVVGLLAVVAVFAPAISPDTYWDQDLSESLQPPSREALLGTDQFGRDLLSRLIYASRPSIQVGVVATGIAIVVGTSIGAMGGYFGGWVDYLTEALVSITWAFPTILMAVFLVSVLGPSLANIMIAVGLVSWASYARVVRAQVLSLKETDFVLAARVVGAGEWRIILRHVLPNTLSPVIVMASLGMASSILAEAALSFLGLGIQPPAPSWGSILSDARSFLTIAPWLSIPPGICIMITVLAFNLLGDGLRDATDPHSRR